MEFSLTNRHSFIKDVFHWNQESRVNISGRSSHSTVIY